MKSTFFRHISVFLTILAIFIGNGFAQYAEGVAGNTILRVLGTYGTGVFDQGAAEIVAHDPASQRLFVVNGATSKIDVLSISNPSVPTLLFSIDLSPYGRSANSVAVKNGIVAVAVEAVVKTDRGRAVFFSTDGVFLRSVVVGALPDMLTFTPDGKRVLVANEGEPNADYTIDPLGSVSIIELANGFRLISVTEVDFTRFKAEDLDPSIRIFGPNANVARNIEPEYIAVSDDSRFAYVTLQENNAIGILNLQTKRFARLVGLGFKDHSLDENRLDASDQPTNTNPRGMINIANWPVYGMYQPDGIASINWLGQTFLITANEGDAREYLGTPGFIEEARISSLDLDNSIFPTEAVLKNNANIGRLNVSRASGDFDNDGDYDALFAFGARSFSIHSADGNRVYDSGDDLEQITAAAYPSFFNASSTNNNRDDRSDNKGPEPEGVTTGVAYGRTFAFIGLERIGGVMVYDVSNPYSPQFVQYINNRNFLAATNTAAAGDLAPEGLHFITAENSPIGIPLLVVANETSGTTTVYEFGPA